MSYRALDDIDNKIISAVQYIGAREGAQNATAKKVATMCDISDFAVFAHFGTKKGYLDAARDEFYQKYLNRMKDLEAENASLEQTWDTLLDDFIQQPDGAIYYSSYISTFGIDEEYQKRRISDFLPNARRLLASEGLDDDNLVLIWDHMVNLILYYTSAFAKGKLVNNERTRELIKCTAFRGLEGHGITGYTGENVSHSMNDKMTSIYTGFNNESPYGKS